MATDTLTGSRIRERRIMAGQKQAELAREIGISASYLNLIEHNRRRIGGKLLLKVAGALGVEPPSLTEGAEAALIASLREAAEAAGMTGEEAQRADDFAGRFPGWAEALAATRRRVAALERTAEALTDRMAHDPHLGASMHELLTTAAAIRSTVSILNDNKALEPEWRNRFHANLGQDSRRLSDSAQALVSYLEAGEGAQDAASSPQEEVDIFLARHGFHFPQVEAGQGAPAIDAVIEDDPDLQSPAARHIARRVLEEVARDARNLPLPKLEKACKTHGADPAKLASALKQPPARILRRLAAMPSLGAGLVVCDRSGTVIFRKSVEGFSVPRHGACCPLWPLFAALSQPGVLVAETIAQLSRGQAPFQAYATAQIQGARDYNTAPLVYAVMLLVPLTEGGGRTRSMGATCRVCPATECGARREPSILTSAT